MSIDPVSIAKEAGGLVARPAFNALKEFLKHVNEYGNNVDEVQRLHKSLKHLKEETDQKVEVGNMNNQTVVPAVREWMKDVNKFMDPEEEHWKDILLEEEARRKAEQCCLGFCWSPKYRYIVSKKAVKQADNINKKIQELRDRGTNPVTLDAKPPELASVSSSFLKGLKSRENKLSEILDKLKDDQVNRIGIHGMGGAGKTTLVQELARQCEHQKIFSAIVVAEISEFPDYKSIQDQIADRIGFNTLNRYRNIEERAIHLGNRLMRIKKEQGSYSDYQHVVAKLVNDEDVKEGEQKSLNKAPTIKNLNKLSSIKEMKLGDVGKKARSEMLESIEEEEEAQIVEIKHGVDDEKEGQFEENNSAQEEKHGWAEKSGKLLVILDNVWNNLDLHLVGIPYELEKDLGCKIIVTSRSEDACKTINTPESCIFNVGDLDDEESRQLFKEIVGKVVDNEGYKEITEMLLNACSHLPLSISLIAATLKNQSLSVWKRMLEQLKNPIQEGTVGVLGEIYSVIEMSYMSLGSKEMKMFFLLCCIFPHGSAVPISELLRYGIGLDLFQYVNSIVEATDQAYRWANHLKSLSLLIEVNIRKGVINIHDDVRISGKSFATKGEHAFHVGDIPRWLKSYSYHKYTVISLMSNNSYKHLDGRTLPELQLLRSLGMNFSKLSQNYFLGMKNLKVLDMSNSDIEIFPSSFEFLTKLEILLLENCTVKDISQICKLVKLQVLSLRKSNVIELPKEMGALIELKMLDLTDCNLLKTIPSGIIVHLTQLEGLYMMHSFSDWTISGSLASLSELTSLPLQVLEIVVKNTTQLPDGDLPILDLSRYKIDLGVSTSHEQDPLIFSRDLRFEGVHVDYLMKKGWKPLTGKAESLYLREIQGLENISPHWGEYGWKELKRILIVDCLDIKHIISRKVAYQSVVFPKLEILVLEYLPALKAIYHGKSPPVLFSNLQELTLMELFLKTCDISIQQTQRLRLLKVTYCKDLVSIFSAPTAIPLLGRGEVKSSHEIGFPCLEELILKDLKALRGLFVEKNTEDSKRCLFPKRVMFPCLETIKLSRLDEIEQLWDMVDGQGEVTAFPTLQSISLIEINIKHVWSSKVHMTSIRFDKLKDLRIRGCDSMEIVCPPSIASGFSELEVLQIGDCKELKQVISTEEEAKHDICFEGTMTFPKLLTLELDKLLELTYFYQGKLKMELQVIKILKLDNLPQMKTFTRGGPRNIKAHRKIECQKDDGVLFSGEMKFPCLEQLYADGLNSIEGIWDLKIQQFSMMFPSLQGISLQNMDNLKYVWSEELFGATAISIGLKDIKIKACDSLASLFAPSAAGSNSSVEVKFPGLETIAVESSGNFQYMLQGNQSLTFPRVRKIKLSNLGEMVTFAKLENSRGGKTNDEDGNDPPIPLFHRKISMPFLEELELEELRTVEKLWDMTSCEEFSLTFPTLQTLSIKDMPKLKHVWSYELNEQILCLGSLEDLTIVSCKELDNLFSPWVSGFSPQHQLHQKTVSFPKLKRLVLHHLETFRCLYQKECSKMEFQALEWLSVGGLPLVRSFVESGSCCYTKREIGTNRNKQPDEQDLGGYDESNTEEGADMIMAKEDPRTVEEDSFRVKFGLFKGNVDFSSLEALEMIDMFELESICECERDVEVSAEACSYSVFPTLERLYLDGGDEIKMRRILKAMIHKLRFLSIKDFHNLRYIVSSNGDTVSTGGALVNFNLLSESKNLEELIIEDCDSLEKLFDLESQDQATTVSLSSIRTLNLSGLGKLKSVQWHMVPNLQSMRVANCIIEGSKFLIPATSVAGGLSLQSLESMLVMGCYDMETIIGTDKEEELVDDVHHEIKFPRLKEVQLERMSSLCMFSSTTRVGNINLPSLASINFQYCGILTSFSSGPVDAPKLSKLQVNRESVAIVRDPNTTLQLRFDSEYKDSKYWPRKLKSKLHEEHYLSLTTSRTYRCGLCFLNSPSYYSYTCLDCDFDLDPPCALDESQLAELPEKMQLAKDWPKILSHELDEHELKLVAGREYGCDGCNQGGELFSYYCEICEFDLHPKCALEGSSVQMQA